MGGAMSRRKGKTGELEWSKVLKAAGFEKARRGQQFHGGPESPDVVGVPGVHWEVKRAETFSPYKALEQAREEARKGRMPVVAHRRNDKDWIVVLGAEDFIRLLKEAADGVSERTKKQDDGPADQGC